jgi:hypothetical protein
MEGTFNFDGEGRASVVSAPPWSIDALRSIQGELEFLREKVADTTLSDFTLDQIVEKTAHRILDQRDDKLTRKIIQGVEERLAADRADRYRKKKRLRTATVWFLSAVIQTLTQIVLQPVLQPAVEQIEFEKLWTAVDTAVHDALDHGPEGGGTGDW